jgi:hypothetical protein
MVVSLATGEKVSMKSIPACWVNPRATSLALCLSMLPSGLNFVLYNHLQLIGCFPAGRGSMVQVLLSSRAANS